MNAFDFVIVGAGSAGAVIAARLSEDPAYRVALIEAGERPPPAELMPAACASMQKQPATDWMYTADPGRAGLGLRNRRVPVPRGKMLGGTSGLNYLAYVRGHPGDFDAWADGGATGWSYEDVLPWFKKSEGLEADGETAIELSCHGLDGPMGVSVRKPVLAGAQEFVEAAESAGIPTGDYNGRDRLNPAGVASLLQTTARAGRRSSTYHAFLEPAEGRPNLTILTGARVTRVMIEDSPDGPHAAGLEYVLADGTPRTATASKEVILSAGAVGSPHLLLLSGIGPRRELESHGIACLVDSPHVGKHLKDHIMVPLFFTAPGVGIPVIDVALSMGPDALRAPNGPLPADPADDAGLPPELQGLKQEAERRAGEWAATGHGLAASSLYDASAWFSTGLGDHHSNDGQIAFIPCGFTAQLWYDCLHVDPAEYCDDPAVRLAPGAESVLVLATLALPHSEGEIALESADAAAHPAIRMNYYADPHDMTVMLAIIRRALAIVAHWPAHRRIGALLIPPALAAKHGHVPGADPSDALLQDLALHYTLTVYHLTSTCRIGSVVDPELRVLGVDRLRVADASVMPEIISGNTNATCIMIGEKAAAMIAEAHTV